MRLLWSVLARADLEHIHAYIAEDNPRAAVAVLTQIRRAIRGQLGNSPFSGRPGRVEGTRELVVPRLPYIVAYRVKDSTIQILRILHGARKWPNRFDE